jgi:hypothetical protein
MVGKRKTVHRSPDVTALILASNTLEGMRGQREESRKSGRGYQLIQLKSTSRLGIEGDWLMGQGLALCVWCWQENALSRLSDSSPWIKNHPLRSDRSAASEVRKNLRKGRDQCFTRGGNSAPRTSTIPQCACRLLNQKLRASATANTCKPPVFCMRFPKKRSFTSKIAAFSVVWASETLATLKE